MVCDTRQANLMIGNAFVTAVSAVQRCFGQPAFDANRLRFLFLNIRYCNKIQMQTIMASVAVFS
jgi:hypothetical protein